MPGFGWLGVIRISRPAVFFLLQQGVCRQPQCQLQEVTLAHFKGTLDQKPQLECGGGEKSDVELGE